MTAKFILENIFGVLSLILWTIQLLPQVYKNYKRKSTEGLSLGMMSIWFIGAVLISPYFIVMPISVALIVQPHGFALLSMTCVLQDCFYDIHDKWKKRFYKLFRIKLSREEARHDSDENIRGFEAELNDFKKNENGEISKTPQQILRKKNLTQNYVRTAILTLFLLLVWAGIEVGIYFLLTAYPNNKALYAAVDIIPNILTFIGFIPQYIDVFKARSTKGLSVFFLVLDILGGVFGIISLAFTDSGSFNYMAAILYIIVTTGDTGLLCCFFIFKGTENNK